MPTKYSGTQPFGSRKLWYRTEIGDERVARLVSEQAEAIEQENSGLYKRFLRYATLYDPHDRLGIMGNLDQQHTDYYIANNVVRQAVDTAQSIISKSRPRVAVNTDGGDWSTQRNARWVERYIEATFRKTKFYEKAQDMFVDAAVLGTGFLKITIDRRGYFDVKRVLADEIVVDERENRGRAPCQLFQRSIVDRDELAAEYPDFDEDILKDKGDAQGSSWNVTFWADYRPIETTQVVVIEAWRRPYYGEDGTMIPGRHVKTACGQVLLDEEWKFDEFPFLVYRWAKRRVGYYGRGIAEELAGRQRAINRMTWQYDRRLQMIAVPRHYVHPVDAAACIKLYNTAGAWIPVYKGPPTTHIAPAVSGDEWAWLEKQIAGGLAEVGISAFSARGTKPGGVESGAAMRELTDTESERFARNQQDFDGIFVGGGEHIVLNAKAAGRNAPELPWRSSRISKLIRWKDVDLGEAPYALVLDAAGSIARTPAGRMQRVIELAQSGLVGQDEARRLMEMPDVKRAMTLANSAIEAVEFDLEAMLEGERREIEPYMNIALSVGRAQQEYLTVRNEGAPEKILGIIQSYIDGGVWQLNQAKKGAAALAPPPMGMPVPGMPPMPPTPGTPAQPSPSLSTQAMQLQAV